MGLTRWLYPGIGVKRWCMLIGFGGLLCGMGMCMAASPRVNLWLGLAALLLGLIASVYGFRQALASLIGVVIHRQGGAGFAERVYRTRTLERGPAIVAIGGGTGLSNLLRGLKEYTSNITAIVTVTDDGGSSGRLRNDMGILPPGDIRNCLLALADRESLMEQLFSYRFDVSSELSGHSVGNLVIAALTNILGGFDRAVQESSKVLAIQGRVLPSTLCDATLGAELLDGSLVKGETHLTSSEEPIRKVFLDPPVCPAMPEALEAIYAADIIVLGPGSLYTSVIPNLLVRDVARAIRDSRAVKTYVCNVMTQKGETDGYSVCDHVDAVLRHSFRGVIDYCVVNERKPSPASLSRYADLGQRPVIDDSDALADLDIRVKKAPVVSESEVVRHEPSELAKAIVSIHMLSQQEAEAALPSKRRPWFSPIVAFSRRYAIERPLGMLVSLLQILRGRP